jgi:hypothetical protein
MGSLSDGYYGQPKVYHVIPMLNSFEIHPNIVDYLWKCHETAAEATELHFSNELVETTSSRENRR